ncbi:hypothetical protein ABZY16_29715 [Streptomyces sp. NPDC006553]|uniref:hypothetical protein n=1 Tax=Streptomyces sp. NPDC006553 TaxID=3157180 RepID=UPI0033AA22C6
MQRALPHRAALVGERGGDETLDGPLRVGLRQTARLQGVADDVEGRSRRPASELFSSFQADSINAVRS